MFYCHKYIVIHFGMTLVFCFVSFLCCSCFFLPFPINSSFLFCCLVTEPPYYSLKHCCFRQWMKWKGQACYFKSTWINGHILYRHMKGGPGASGRVLPPVTGRSRVRVAVSSHCTGEGKACHWHPSPDPAQSGSSLHWVCPFILYRHMFFDLSPFDVIQIHLYYLIMMIWT